MVVADLAWRFLPVEDEGKELETREIERFLRGEGQQFLPYLKQLLAAQRAGIADQLIISPTAWGMAQVKKALEAAAAKPRRR
jgi:hypothetical protein